MMHPLGGRAWPRVRGGEMKQLRAMLHPTAPILAAAEPLALLLVAPLLLFPAIWPRWTAAGLALLAVLALARWIVTGELWPATAFNAALFLFVLALPAAWWASAWRDLSWPKLTGIVLGLAAFRVLAQGIHDRRTLNRGLAAFSATGAGILAIGALNTGWPSKVAFLQPLVERLPKVFTALPGAPDQGVHANQLAGAALVYLSFALALAVGSWREGRRGIALAALAGAAVAGCALLLTQSRSGWAGGAAGLAALGVLGGLASRRRWARAAALVLPVALVVAVGGVLATLGTQRLEALWSPSGAGLNAGDMLGQLSLAGRVEVWSRALYAIQDFPFTGVGLGAFRRVVQLLYPLFTAGPDYDIAHAHNMFLQVALDVGLPGLIAYLALLWVAGVVAWQAAQQGSAPLVRALAIGLPAGLVGLHVYGLTDALALGSKPGITFWMILGLLAALPRVMRQDARTGPESEPVRFRRCCAGRRPGWKSKREGALDEPPSLCFGCRGCSAQPQADERVLHAVVRADAVLHVRDVAGLVDQEVRTDDAHVGLAIHALLAPHAVGLRHGGLGIGEQLEGQVELRPELRVALLAVRADAKDDGVLLLDRHVVVAEAAGLGRAAGRVVFGVEVQHHALSPQVAQPHRAPIVRLQREVGRGAPHHRHVRRNLN